MRTTVIDEAKEILHELQILGMQQVTLYKSVNPKEERVPISYLGGQYRISPNGFYIPSDIVAHSIEILIDPVIFFLITIESFWNFFQILQKKVDCILIQFAVRGLLEYAYRILWYSELSEQEKKKTAIKYWLCHYGLILSGQHKEKRMAQYKKLLTELTKAEQEKFPSVLDVASRNVFHRIQFRLFPSLTDERLKGMISKIRPKLWRGFSGDDIEKFFRSLSGYSHADMLYIRNIEQEQENKKFIWRCVATMFIAGHQVIETTNKKLPPEKNIDLQKIVDKMRNMATVLYTESRYAS